MTFSPLLLPGFEHAFTLRRPNHLPGPFEGPAELARQGFPCPAWTQAEQVHGNLATFIDASHIGAIVTGADALVTRTPGITLVIRVADCGPIYLIDPVNEAIGLAHSGKKGTETNILAATVEAMGKHCGSQAGDLVVFLGPCIRPPHYDVDFATEISRQAESLKLGSYTDSALDTASDLEKYYSYRMEKGQTGRLFAALRILPE